MPATSWLNPCLQFFLNFIINNPADISVATHAMSILRHNFINVLTSQIIPIHFSTTNLLLTVKRLRLVFVDCFSCLLSHLFIGGALTELVLPFQILLLVHLADISAQIWTKVQVGLPTLLSGHHVIVRWIEVVMFDVLLVAAVVAQIKTLDMLDINVTQIVLTLIELLLNLPILLVLLLLVYQVLVLKLLRRNFVIQVQMPDKQALLSLLI